MYFAASSGDCPCDCPSSAMPEQPAVCGLRRRQLLGAALMGGLGAWGLPAVACPPEAVAEAAHVVAPRNVCMECLARRAQQRSAFVNKELP